MRTIRYTCAMNDPVVGCDRLAMHMKKASVQDAKKCAKRDAVADYCRRRDGRLIEVDLIESRASARGWL